MTLQTKLLVLVALAVPASGVQAADLSVAIDSPANATLIEPRQEVSGKVSDADADVWVVIHPLETSDFWVQPPVTVSEGGAWKVLAYFGDSATKSGTKFEVRAFANPEGKISEGKVAQWPRASARSNVVEIARR